MRALVVAGLAAILVVGTLVGLRTVGDGGSEDSAEAATTTTQHLEQLAATTTAPPTTSLPATTSPPTTAGSDCTPSMVPHVIATGWFDSLTAEPVPEAVQIGDRFFMANVVQLEFPIDGGPAYFYSTAVWIGTETSSVFAVADSRAAEPPDSPDAPEHFLVYDAGTGTMAGSGTIGVAYETVAAGDTPDLETVYTSSGFAATYDAASGTLTGEILHPDETFTFRAEATVEDRNLWPSAACYREAVQSAIEADQP